MRVGWAEWAAQVRAELITGQVHPRVGSGHVVLDLACRLLSVDISCSRDAQQQTRCTPLLLSIDGTDNVRTDGKTDRQTLDSFIDPAPDTTLK